MHDMGAATIGRTDSVGTACGRAVDAHPSWTLSSQSEIFLVSVFLEEPVELGSTRTAALVVPHPII